MEEIIIRQDTAITNKELVKATEEIFTIYRDTQKNAFRMCAIIADVAANKYYVDDGFKNVTDWAKQFFGMSKATVYNYIKIGTEFLTESVKLDKNGKKCGKSEYKSIFADDNGDFALTQILKLFPLDSKKGLTPDEIKKEYVDTGIISYTMTAAEIEKKVNEIVSEETAETEDETETAETAETEDETETAVKNQLKMVEENGIRYFELNGNRYEVNNWQDVTHMVSAMIFQFATENEVE